MKRDGVELTFLFSIYNEILASEISFVLVQPPEICGLLAVGSPVFERRERGRVADEVLDRKRKVRACS